MILLSISTYHGIASYHCNRLTIALRTLLTTKNVTSPRAAIARPVAACTAGAVRVAQLLPEHHRLLDLPVPFDFTGGLAWRRLPLRLVWARVSPVL